MFVVHVFHKTHNYCVFMLIQMDTVIRENNGAVYIRPAVLPKEQRASVEKLLNACQGLQSADPCWWEGCEMSAAFVPNNQQSIQQDQQYFRLVPVPQ